MLAERWRVVAEAGIGLFRTDGGEVFTLDDFDKCRLEIENRNPKSGQPTDSDSGTLFAVEAIRQSFGNKLYRYPIEIDFGTPNRRTCIIHPSNSIEYEKQQDYRLLRVSVTCPAGEVGTANRDNPRARRGGGAGCKLVVSSRFDHVTFHN